MIFSFLISDVYDLTLFTWPVGCAALGHTDKYLVAEDEYHINIV